MPEATRHPKSAERCICGHLGTEHAWTAVGDWCEHDECSCDGMGEATRHTLVRDGWPHYAADHPAVVEVQIGRAMCSCTWVSEPLPTTQARRAAWTQHGKETER